MGREVRRVPPDWQHPRDAEGDFIPLHAGDLAALQADWDVNAAKWAEGLRLDFSKPPKWIPYDENDRGTTYDAWDGERPLAAEYMPQWSAEQSTHWQMYETTSEGTPISPVFDTPENLARWLTDTGANTFGHMTATYEQWLSTMIDEHPRARS